MSAPTVRDATFDVLRRRGLTTLFANPGSTEVTLLTGLPDDLRFVLALHESAVVGIATGWAIGRREPALAILHTTAGLGNAVGALATARVNRAPLVVLVGQQDRRHLPLEPFLAGRLDGLAGEYPVWVDQPPLAEQVPASIDRAWHEAQTARGPALVIVPMDDWSAPAGDAHDVTSPDRVVRAAAADAAAVAELAQLVESARTPALVVGAGVDTTAAWAAVVALAEQMNCPVWQESFGARAGFPQDHRLFAGHLPADRTRLRERLAPFDLVLCLGAAAFRQYSFESGPLVETGTRLAVVSEDPAEVHRSPAELGVLAPVAAVCAELARLLSPREGAGLPLFSRPAAPPPEERLRAGHVLAALAERLPENAVVVEEIPSNRPELHARLGARNPLGFLSAAMGGLGFAVPAAAGIRMGRTDLPVVAVVGDGSSLYCIQALWTAAHYRAGALFVVLANGGYAVMDRLAERHGGSAPWPGFDVDIAGIATAFGCPARRIGRLDELLATLDETVPGLAERDEPLLLEIEVEPDPDFVP